MARNNNNNLNNNNLNNNNLNNNNLNNNNLNNSNNSNNKGKSKGSKTVIIVGVVILLVIIAVAGYFLYRYYKKQRVSTVVTKQLIPYIHDATVDKRFNNSSLPGSSQGNEYNINVWLYVNDYKYELDNDKCIVYKGDVLERLINADPENNSNTKCNPSIWLLKNVNTLRVLIGLETKYNQNDCNSTQSVCGSEVVDAETCDIPNFPLQTWVNLNVSLRSNVLDIFMNGELVKSCILGGFPIITKGDMYVCKDGGFNGYISNMKYSNKALSTNDISKLYRNGPTLK